MTPGRRADVHDRLEPFRIEPDGVAVTALGAGLLGGLGGVAWSGALRLWMTHLVAELRVTSATVTLILVPGGVVGGLLGHAWRRERLGSPVSRWFVAAPLGLAVVVLVPSYAVQLATTGQGSGAIAVPLIGMAGGYAVSARGPRRGGIHAGLLAGAGVVGMSVAPVAMNPGLEPATHVPRPLPCSAGRSSSPSSLPVPLPGAGTSHRFAADELM